MRVQPERDSDGKVIRPRCGVCGRLAAKRVWESEWGTVTDWYLSCVDGTDYDGYEHE
jgi:hypothetical protein